MKFCVHCVKDPFVKAMINNVNLERCDICGKSNVKMYDTDTDEGLENEFSSLLEIYTCNRFLPRNFSLNKKTLLKDELCDKWKIFNTTDKDVIYDLITNICKEKYKSNKELFDEPIALYSPNSQEISLLGEYKWSDFCNSIKLENRFNSNHINFEILERFLKSFKEEYSSSYPFYRARICENEIGFIVNEMGAPKPGKSTPGRANPIGISYLYLSDNEDTAISEVRAKYDDYVCVGKFEIKKENIKLVDLDKLDKISPFCGLEDLFEYAINFEHLKKIRAEIAKPLRSTDSPLDYLPTQYISEFIKSKGYDGIKYKSTVSQRNSFNIVIFDSSIATCIDTKVYSVKLNYTFNEIN